MLWPIIGIIGVIIYVTIICLNVYETQKNISPSTVSIGSVLIIAITVPFVPFGIVILGLFAIYRLLVSIVLRVRHGKNFAGLLSGPDAFHLIGESSKFITVCCMMIQTKAGTLEENQSHINELFRKVFHLRKFRMLFCKSFGYPFVLRQKIDVNDCYGEMVYKGCEKTELNKDELYELLNYHYNMPMPQNGKIPFQFLIGSQFVKWRNDNFRYYPVMFKVHHAVGDGISLLKCILGCTSDDVDVQPEAVDNSVILNAQEKSVKSSSPVVETFMAIFSFSLFCPSTAVLYLFYKGKDNNSLNKPTVTHENVIGIASEEREEYVQKIKKIKQSFPGTAFSSVLMAAYSASLNEYFEKKCISLPMYITASMPIVRGAENLRYLTIEEAKLQTDLKNSYSLVLFRLPVAVKNCNRYKLVRMLTLINQEVNILKKSWEYFIMSFFMQVVCKVFPLPLIKVLLEFIHSSTIVSILTGPQKIVYRGGIQELTNIIPWVPHLNNIGTSIGIMTYNGRLNIGLSIDKAIISDRSDVQAIADNIFKYIDDLYNETEEYCNMSK